jgi:hypothetical protein
MAKTLLVALNLRKQLSALVGSRSRCAFTRYRFGSKSDFNRLCESYHTEVVTSYTDPDTIGSTSCSLLAELFGGTHSCRRPWLWTHAGENVIARKKIHRTIFVVSEEE